MNRERALTAVDRAEFEVRGHAHERRVAFLHDLFTAAALHLHPNTVRYRIRRFEERSGLRCHHVTDLLMIWWAVRHERIGATTEEPRTAP
ncbi:MAG TPA: helix-turn-helix domain-containing protein [Thermomonospora sp.]|nr:helix-turn-helix domain-containing protein [Thermomonospora sp.]